MPLWICRIPFLKSRHNIHKFQIFRSVSLVSFSTSTPEISLFDYLVNHQQFSPECASKVPSSSSTTFLGKPERADSVFNFLKETGFAKNQIEAVIQKTPSVLSSDVERSIKPKMKVFEDLGFHSTDVADIISTTPWLLGRSANRLRSSVLGLMNVLGPDADICKLLKRPKCGMFLARDLDRTLLPNSEYLKSCGISSLQIATYVCRYPLAFLVNPDTFKGVVKRVDEMGMDRKSKMFVEAFRVMMSMSRKKWELKLELFREVGFSGQNILHAFRKQPQAFAVSERKIKEVTQLLLSVEDISYIAKYPLLLSFSVEKRLKPRLRVVKALESKNLLEKIPALFSFIHMTDAKFVSKYVSPYQNEVGDLYVGN